VLEARFRIGGRCIALRADRDAVPFRLLADEWAAMRIEDTSPADAEIELLPRAWEEPSPLRLPEDAVLIRMGGRKIFASGDDYYIDFHENAFFRLEGRRAAEERHPWRRRHGLASCRRAVGVCYLHETLDPTFWTELCLNHVLLLLLRRLGLFFLHAGGAMAPNGVGIIFIGSGGSGKSTASMRLAEAGWPWFGDDGVLWDAQGVVHAFPRRAAATDWTVARLSLMKRVVGARLTGKWLLAPWPAAPASTALRFFYPLPALNGCNRIEPMEVPLCRRLVASQMTLCRSDERLAGPTADPSFIEKNLVAIRIGDLDGLPDFLMRAVLP
jgi:hypothetical protein